MLIPLKTFCGNYFKIAEAIRSSKSQNVDIFVTYFHFSIDLIKVLFDIETDHIVSFVRKNSKQIAVMESKRTESPTFKGANP